MSSLAVQHRPFEALARIIYKLLEQPQSLESLSEVLTGATPGDDPLTVIEAIVGNDHRIGWQPDFDVYYRYDALLANTVLTHRVTPEELAQGRLVDSATVRAAARLFTAARFGSRPTDEDLIACDGPDLELVYLSVEQTRDITFDGDGLNPPRLAHLSGPDGWLDGCEPNGLCGFRVVDNPDFEDAPGIPYRPYRVEFVGRVDEESSPATTFGDILVPLLERTTTNADPVVEPEDLLDLALLDHPKLFKIVPPVEETAEEVGLSVRGYHIGPKGFDWDRWRTERPMEIVSNRYRLDGSEQRRLARAVTSFDQWNEIQNTSTEERSPEDQSALTRIRRTAGELLISTMLADAFGAVVIMKVSLSSDSHRDRVEAHRAIGRFANELLDEVTGQARVPYLWLMSMSASVVGSGEEQLSLLETARQLDADDWAVAEDLGYCRVDQSRYDEAFELLSQARASGPVMNMVANLTWMSRADIGRNDPCPCDSGRKFKQCHGRSGATISAADATAALYQKPTRFVGGEQLDLPRWTRWSSDWAGDEPGVDWSRGLSELDELGTLVDILLTEGGGFDQFITLRRALLPADEVQLAERWATVPRSVFRVELDDDTGSTPSFHLSDLVDENRVDCTGDPAGRALNDGSIVVARPLPIGGGTHRLYSGVVALSPSQVEAARAVVASPERTAETVARGLAELVEEANAANDGQVLCFAAIATDDPDVLDRWEEDNVTFDPSGDPVLQIGQLDDGTMVVDKGSPVTFISYSKQEHESLLARLTEELGPYQLLAEHAVTAKVLREEVLLLNREFLDGPTIPGADPRGEFDSALLVRILETAITLGIHAGNGD